MKKIREFATLCGTTEKTLRYYDRIGLLEARYTDPDNGYRYYSDEQQHKYKIIRLFQEMGFTLEEIRSDLLEQTEEHVLEKLKERQAQLKGMLDLCERQIQCREDSIRRRQEIAAEKRRIERIEEENRIVVRQGNVSRMFTAPTGAMDVCAGILHELFCTPGYVSLDLADIPEQADDRAVLVQTMEGTAEEIAALTPEQIFTPEDNAAAITAALFTVELSRDTSLNEVKRIVAVAGQCFSPENALIWGAAFSDERPKGTARIGIIGLY